jgi:hypothetical protein
VLVACTLLVTGLLATLTLLDNGAKATGSTVQRDRGNALAQEIVERATGLRYTRERNDLVASDAAARIAAGLRPTAAAVAPTATAPTMLEEPADRFVKRWAWTQRRGGTEYRITFRACTHSDRVQQVVLQGPMDCTRAGSGGSGGAEEEPVPGPPGCALKLRLVDVDGAAGPAGQAPRPEDVTVRLQLLGPLLNLDLCTAGVLDVLNLGSLVAPVCHLLGPGNTLLGNVPKLLNGLLDVLASGSDIGLCRESDVEHELHDITAGMAASTSVEVEVSWSDPFTGRSETLRQSAVLRRTAQAPVGTATP